MKISRAMFLVFAVLLAGCVQPSMRKSADDSSVRGSTAKHAAIDYQSYVVGSAPWFNFQRLSDWSSPDPSHVVVWTTPSQAYLLTLFGACFSLADAPTIMLSTHGMVSAGNDAVIVQGERCPIQRIDRLDGRRLRAALDK